MMASEVYPLSLQQLLAGVVVEADHLQEWQKTIVTGLSVDSRKISEGNCFIAYPGHHSDGRDYISRAVKAGAGSIIVESAGLNADLPVEVPVVAVANLQSQLSILANNFYQTPSAELSLFAVTGTNGKTSISQMVAGAAAQMGLLCGVIGTLGNGLLGQIEPTINTTPDVIESNRLLRAMASAGADLVAMEMSSHGLVQGRCEGLKVDTALISNISRDHLDYHQTMEAYCDAKAILAQNPGIKHLVLNADDDLVISLSNRAQAGVQIWSFSLSSVSDVNVYAQHIRFHKQGISLDVAYNDQRANINSSLIGDFNASNLLAATTALLALGFELTAICDALAKLGPVPGRMQRVGDDVELPTVVVDFAHTPDALEKALLALRRHCAGRLWCVFGCGGDRDAGKRPLMAEIAGRLADELVITADNPRTEKLSEIISQMVKGIPQATAFQIIETRKEAVYHAVTNATADDLVLLAGKGHEDYQEIAGEKLDYSDILVAQQALASRRRGGMSAC